MSSDLVDLALRCWSYAEYCGRSTCDLCSTGVMNDFRTKTKTDCLGLKQEHLFLAFNLQGHLKKEWSG